MSAFGRPFRLLLRSDDHQELAAESGLRSKDPHLRRSLCDQPLLVPENEQTHAGDGCERRAGQGDVAHHGRGGWWRSEANGETRWDFPRREKVGNRLALGGREAGAKSSYQPKDEDHDPGSEGHGQQPHCDERHDVHERTLMTEAESGVSGLRQCAVRDAVRQSDVVTHEEPPTYTSAETWLRSLATDILDHSDCVGCRTNARTALDMLGEEQADPASDADAEPGLSFEL